MKLATSTGDFYGYTASQIKSMQLIREAGFHYADMSFNCGYAQRADVYSDNYEKYIEEIAQAADDIGIKLIQAHAPMGKPIAQDNEQFIADTIRCVEACGAWGIPNLVVHSGYLPNLSVEETFAKNKEFFMPILEAAEKYGLNILVENFNKMTKPDVYWIDNAPDLLAMIEYVNHPLFHAVWDTGHANLQEMPQDEGLRLLGSHVRALHVQDNMGDADTHLTPFFGTMNMDALMNGLSDIGYSGYFTFEVGGIFTPPQKRRPCERDTRLTRAPLELRLEFERFLYKLGKCILEAYNCYEI